MKRLLCAFSSCFLALSLSLPACDDHGWTVLFDGESVASWRGFRSEDFPSGGWKIEEGVLTSIGDGDRIDIITKDRYANFELKLEWRVEPGGNSGIFYRVSEEPTTIWHFAPEFQIIDDARVNNPVQSAGALYDLVPPNEKKELRPVGEFNSSRIVIQGDMVEHWLNGEKIVTFDFNAPDLKEKLAKSKFAQHENFGQIREGHVALQHHGDTVGFRDIRIRELPAPAKD